MPTFTLTKEDSLLRRSLQYAHERGLPLEALVEQLLNRAVAAQETTSVEELIRLLDDAVVDSRGEAWNRDELYEG